MTPGAIRRLEELGRLLEIEYPDVVDLALKHLYGTFVRDQPVWLSDPPPKPFTSGGPHDAA